MDSARLRELQAPLREMPQSTRASDRVRTGLFPGGSRIRTIGPAEDPAVVVISALVAPPSPLRRAEPTRAPLSKPWSSHAVLTVRSGLFQR
jgi:hypothetical protein